MACAVRRCGIRQWSLASEPSILRRLGTSYVRAGRCIAAPGHFPPTRSEQAAVAWLALFLYEGLIAWVGQDYLSPQAFGYLLWLGIVAILIRWILGIAPAHMQRGPITRARAAPPKRLANAMAVIASAESAGDDTHCGDLLCDSRSASAYSISSTRGVGALAVLGLLRRGWLILLIMILIAVAYLASRYSLIAQQYGGLFSGGNVLQNARGKKGAFHDRRLTVEIVAHTRHLLACGWQPLPRSRFNWRALGRVATPALLAFSPFIIIFRTELRRRGNLPYLSIFGTVVCIANCGHANLNCAQCSGVW